MARQFQVTLPYLEEKEKVRTKNVVHMLRGLPFVYGLSTFEGKRDRLVIFRVTPKATGKCIYALQSVGVGQDYGRLDIISLQTTMPRINVRKKPLRKRLQITDRLSVEEVCRQVEAQNVFTFDYLIFVLTAAVIACLGLSTDSASVVVAAMLISPLMGPIVAVALGAAIREPQMIIKGFLNEIAGILLVFITGFLWGLGNSVFNTWETDEQEARGTYWASVAGVGIAIPSGVAVAVAITSGGAASPIVGVAISASLLPPIANAGMHFALALMQRLTEETMSDDWEKSCRIAGYSLLLFIVNFVCIFVSALILFRVKGVKRRKSVRINVAELVQQAKDKPHSPEEDYDFTEDNCSIIDMDDENIDEVQHHHQHYATALSKSSCCESGTTSESSLAQDTFALVINPFAEQQSPAGSAQAPASDM